MFAQQDIDQITAHGLSPEQVALQLTNFRNGFPFLDIRRAATVVDGIIRLNEQDLDRYIKSYEAYLASGKTVIKFVPASGAASRMFKTLFEFQEKYTNTPEGHKLFDADKSSGSIHTFFARLPQFAFYESLKSTLSAQGKDIDALVHARDYHVVLEALLGANGLNYGNMPKGLLHFHNYTDGARTPVEEHLTEAVNYGNTKGRAKVHFTVSPEHRQGFEALVSKVKGRYEQASGVKIDVEYSEQKPSTDTVAADANNGLFYNDDKSLLFRPAGHGALIANLNDLYADILFVKNIDNVVPDRLKEPTYQYKKALAGLLAEYQSKIFAYLEKLDAGVNDALISEIVDFYQKTLATELGSLLQGKSTAEKATLLRSKLNRPVRVCGMVKNEGEPGGGPFWATNPDGTVSLQVVESAQIDPEDSRKAAIVKNATHFNPVDLVCATKDYKGNAFDLTKFVDPATGFISSKSKSGRELKAQELPGLWNGAMSDWNTLFVEVPVITFNPVKIVNDLLRDQHQ